MTADQLERLLSPYRPFSAEGPRELRDVIAGRHLRRGSTRNALASRIQAQHAARARAN
jgi:hypothetical protein